MKSHQVGLRMMIAAIVAAGFTATASLSTVMSKVWDSRYQSNVYSASDFLELYSASNSLSTPSASSPTGYLSVSVYPNVQCSGPVGARISVPTGICVGMPEEAGDIGVQGSEMITVTSTSLFGVTAYQVTINVYNDNNCMLLNSTSQFPFIGGQCLAYGTNFLVSYSSNLPSPPGFGLVSEIYSDLDSCSNGSPLLADAYLATEVCMGFDGTSVYLSSCTGTAMISVYNDTDCDASRILYNTTIVIPDIQSTCENIPNTSAYANAFCYTSASSSPSDTSSCFSGSESVELASGDRRLMSEVMVGDLVLSADRYGKLSYAPVIAVPHGRNDKLAEFVHITTMMGEDIKLTSQHLLLSGACESPFNSWSLIAAKDAVVGACIMSVSSGAPRIISYKSTVIGRGKYTVVPDNEYLVVNGLIVSPFADNHAATRAYYSIYYVLLKMLPASIAQADWIHQANEFMGHLFVKLSWF